jgi:hypothetical protein
MKRSATAAIAAFLSRLGLDRTPRFVVQVSLRQAAKTKNSSQNPAVAIEAANEPTPSYGKAVPSKVSVHLRFDAALLAKADAAAKRQGVTRTAWLHRAAFDTLGKFCGATEEG